MYSFLSVFHVESQRFQLMHLTSPLHTQWVRYFVLLHPRDTVLSPSLLLYFVPLACSVMEWSKSDRSTADPRQCPALRWPLRAPCASSCGWVSVQGRPHHLRVLLLLHRRLVPYHRRGLRVCMLRATCRDRWHQVRHKRRFCWDRSAAFLDTHWTHRALPLSRMPPPDPALITSLSYF